MHLNESLNKIYKNIDENIDSHIEAIQDLLKQPSISAENYGITDCAQLIVKSLEKLHFRKVKAVQTAGHPVVYGEYDAGREKTLLIYHMYDVQPVGEEHWDSPPFEARIVELPPFRRCIIARGAQNSKGPLQAFLNTLHSILEVESDFPVNLIMVIEGEEELGSPHLPQFVKDHAQHLKHADAAFFPFTRQERDGRAYTWLGTKGLLYFELELNGGHWSKGPRSYDIHGSSKVVVDNPAWRMIHALSSMTSADGNTPKIEGFYDDVDPVSDTDRELLEKLAKTFDFAPLKALWDVESLIDEDHGKEKLLKRYFYDPTLNIDGIQSGYTGLGSKTVVPHKIIAKADARLVPRQKTDDIFQKIRMHLNRHGFGEIGMRRLGGGEYSQTSVDSPIVQAVIRGYRRFGVEPEIWPRNVGFVPMYLFSGEPLNLPFCIGGLGHGGRSHSPNEYLVVDRMGKVHGIDGCEKSFAAILYEFASSYAHSPRDRMDSL